MKKWLTSKFDLLWLCGKNGILHICKANKQFEKRIYIRIILAQNSLVFKSKMIFMQQSVVVNKVPLRKKTLI